MFYLGKWGEKLIEQFFYRVHSFRIHNTKTTIDADAAKAVAKEPVVPRLSAMKLWMTKTHYWANSNQSYIICTYIQTETDIIENKKIDNI